MSPPPFLGSPFSLAKTVFLGSLKFFLHSAIKKHFSMVQYSYDFFLIIFQWFPISLGITQRAYLCSSYFCRTISLHSLPTVCFVADFFLFWLMDVLLCLQALSRVFLCMEYLSTPFSFIHLFMVWVSAEPSRVSGSLSWLPAWMKWLFVLP